MRSSTVRRSEDGEKQKRSDVLCEKVAMTPLSCLYELRNINMMSFQSGIQGEWPSKLV